MADITLMGATYTDVPAVDLPKSGGGTARFWEAEDGDEMEYGSGPETWLFNSSLDLTGVGSADRYDVSFTSNSTDYVRIQLGNMSGVLYSVMYDSAVAYRTGAMGNGWENQSYRTITITGGTDANNATFRAWLEANATQQ